MIDSDLLTAVRWCVQEAKRGTGCFLTARKTCMKKYSLPRRDNLLTLKMKIKLDIEWHLLLYTLHYIHIDVILTFGVCVLRARESWRFWQTFAFFA